MHPLIVSAITLFVLFTFAFVILFGDLPNFKGTRVYRFRRWLLSTWDRVLISCKRLDNRYCHGALHDLFVVKLYSVYQWIIPGLYLFLFVVLVYQFFMYSYPRIDSPRTILIVVSLSVNVMSFCMAIYTDPGQLTSVNAKHIRDFPYNELIFFNHELYGHGEKNYCRTCHVLKFPRSKHCSTCNRCVLFVDHHCIWLNNCVGYYNYKWFLSFLVSLIWIFLYGGNLTYGILSLASSKELPAEQAARGNVVQRYYQLISHTTVANERTGIVFLVCVVLPALIVWFTFEHLQFIYLGMTTNESSKWDFVRFLIAEKMLYRYDGSVFLIRDSENTFYRLSDDSIQFQVDKNDKKLEHITDMGKQLTNIYDSGFWLNLKQRVITKRYQ